jgi:hypothetical protein
MSLARLLAALQQGLLVLVLGLGPLATEALGALGHAQVCACCQAPEESCCESREAPPSPEVAPLAGSCPCAAMTPSGRTQLAPAATRSEARPCACGILGPLARELPTEELFSRSLEGRRSAILRVFALEAGPPGARRESGAARASALGGLRL